MSALSDVLKKRRPELGLTLAQIADAMGVSEATVQRWESGSIRNIRPERIALLSQILKVSQASLMGIEENILDPGGRIGRKTIPQKVSDKSMKLVIRIDSGLYDRLCTLAELDNRSCEDELEYLLYWAVAQEIEEREDQDG